MLTHMLAQQADLDVGTFVHSFGDVHLYHNHLTDQIVFEQLGRTPEALPTLTFKRKPPSIFDYQFEDLVFNNYQPQSVIKAPVAV